MEWYAQLYLPLKVCLIEILSPFPNTRTGIKDSNCNVYLCIPSIGKFIFKLKWDAVLHLLYQRNPNQCLKLRLPTALCLSGHGREGLLVNDKEVQCREPQSPEHLKTHSFQPFTCNPLISAPGRSERLGEWHPLQWFEPIQRKQQHRWQLKFFLCGLLATCGNRFVYKSKGLGWEHREEHEGNNPVWSAKGQKKAELEGQPRQEEFALIPV